MGRADRQLRAFGEVVRDRRRALGLSQSAAAARWEVDLTSLKDVESGRGDPGFAWLVDLASGLETSLAELFGEVADRIGGEYDPG